MELLFIDESGDNGFSEGASDFFILAGISIESIHWKEFTWKIKNLRQKIKQKYGLKFSEIKGNDFFTHRGPFLNSLVDTINDLSWIYYQFIDLICDPLLNIFIIRQSKKEFKERHGQGANPKKLIKSFGEWIWMEYMSMYNNYLLYKSNPYENQKNALIYCDMCPGREKYIREVVKTFSLQFDQQSRLSGAGIIEDVMFRNSKSSYFIQLSDTLAYSINKILIGKGEGDMFEIKKEVSEKLLMKANEPNKLQYKKSGSQLMPKA